MKKEKRGQKEVKVYFIIVNLIVATIAFSWMVAAQHPGEDKPADSDNPDTNHIGENPSSNLPSTIAGGVAPLVTQTIAAKGASGSSWVLTSGNDKVLFSNTAKDSITTGSEGTSLITGDKVKVVSSFDSSNLAPATNLQSSYGNQLLNIGGSRTTLANALEDPALKSQLVSDSKIAEQIPGVKSISEEGEKVIFDYGQGKTVSIDENSIISTKEGSSTLSKFFGAAGGTWQDGALTGLQWAGVMFGVGQLIGSIAGMKSDQTMALSTALAAGTYTATFFKTATELKDTFSLGGWGPAAHPYLWGIGVAAVVFMLMYKKESKQVVTFSCKPWQAPIGGGDCEKCNLRDGCSEYKCKSLGQACQLLNAGTGQEKCAWVNPKDTKSPGISPWTDVLTPGYEYKDVRIRPPGEGSEPGRMSIVKKGTKDGCIDAFTPLEFGIVTTGPDGLSEPAQCKIDYNHTLKFDDMAFYFGESNLYAYNHSQKMSLPGPSALKEQAPEIENDGTYTLYARCRDANGNENVDEFAIKFCVQKGPDTTPPKIEGTSIINGMPVKYNQTSVDLDVYINEPADCKWSKQDKSYDNMENTMTCSKNVWEMNNNLVYTCKTTLTGLRESDENVFYFRCKDQPLANESDRMKMQESYKFTLLGTETLNILSVKPNGTIFDSTDVVPVWLEVETANGYKNGEAVCYYSETGSQSDWIEFYDTGTSLHKQRLDLREGSYKYYIKCIDLGGNRDDATASFSVDVDREAPVVARAFKENELLKIVTTEESECRYDIKSCNFKFEDGIDMPYANQTNHAAEWKTDTTYYIRCADKYGNTPVSNECSIIVRPYDILEQKTSE